MNKLFRVSFSILEPWSHGNYDEAVRRWLRIEVPPTQAMEDGKLLHRQWQEETMTTGRLPEIFGGKELEHASPELKMECIIDDWIQFVGVVDCLEAHTIHEYKTGRSNSMYWARTKQTPCYQVLCRLNGIRVKQSLIHHYNQHTKQVTHSKVYLSPNTDFLALEWIRTYASELYNALEAGGQL